jgi:hypothetical protein
MTAPETFLDVFEPPEGMVGHTSALVAMTAAEDFLEAAMERFTKLRPRQRAQLGTVVAYLMLDGHASSSRQGVFPPGRVPGLHELQPRPFDGTSLLHAKLALLAFAASRTGKPAYLRLAVLTANFTYASARRQLELIWTIDVPLDILAPAKDRADIAAAAAFVDELISRRFYRDEHALPVHRRRLSARLNGLLELARSLAPVKVKPRFIHSLDVPLYDQIRQRFRQVIDSPRNLLLCGSGFYEEPSGRCTKPEVLDKLEAFEILTTNARRVALVEPTNAGAIAPWAREEDTDGWELAHPTDALNFNRSLHAKFIYAGYLRDGYASNGCLYIGSGNLSRRGLLTAGSMKEGNIECGIIISATDRFSVEELAKQLFWNPESAEVDHDEWHVGEVGDAPQDATLLTPPPILSASLETQPNRVLSLDWREDVSQHASISISWTGQTWQAVAREQKSIAVEGMDELTTLFVRDDAAMREWTVPIVDLSGRVCWQPPRFDTYMDALAALLDFPIRPSDAASDEDDEADDSARMNASVLARDGQDAKSYALWAAAELIEKTAALQIALPATILDDWLDHLDRMLGASFPQSLITTWRNHKLDVLLHLRAPELRPPQMSETQRTRYIEILDRAASAWGLR